jgi:hypothetical protein
MEPYKQKINLTPYERDIFCGICSELGGVFKEKAKRGDPKRFRTKGVINYSLYGLIHGSWTGRDRDSVNYSMANKQHPLIELLKKVLSDKQWEEFLFHQKMSPLEYHQTRNETWNKKELEVK